MCVILCVGMEELKRALRAEVCGGFDVPLFIHPRTARCIVDGCVVCAYRLLVRLPRACRKHAAPNERPEKCLRTQGRLMRRAEEDREDLNMQHQEWHRLHGRRGTKKRRKRGMRPRSSSTPSAPSVSLSSSSTSSANATSADAPSFSVMTSQLPRATTAGLYSPRARSLIVGDGDLSFSVGLCHGLAKISGSNPARNVVATTYLSHDELVQTYGKPVEANIRALQELGVTTIHGVDATLLGESNCNVMEYFRSPGSYCSSDDVDGGGSGKNSAGSQNQRVVPRFHRVIWNFPCVHSPLDASGQAQRGRDGQNEEMESNKTMLREFFERCVNLLEPGGEVHLVHKTKPPYNQWDLSDLVAESGMRLEAAVVFDRELYPGYTNRKALVGRGSFPISDARTFVFMSPLVLRNGRGIFGTLRNDCCRLILVNDELLLKVYANLTKRKEQQEQNQKNSSRKRKRYPKIK